MVTMTQDELHGVKFHTAASRLVEQGVAQVVPAELVTPTGPGQR